MTTRTGPQKYPGASTVYWYQGNRPGSAMETNVIVWHSTEGTSLPGYSGGAVAPNLTAKPDFTAKVMRWYQHFDFDVSARALVNAAGGVQTNTLNVTQVEVVGTCDPTTHAKWTKAGTAHLYMPELPAWAIRDLAAFARWAHDQHGVPLSSGLTFKAYPGSYGAASGVRMSASQWTSFEGHCGHQHVPENLHGDPGAFPMAAILIAAKGGTTEEDDMTPDQAAQLKALHDNLLHIGSLTEVDAKGQRVSHAAGYYLAHIHYDALKIWTAEVAQSSALAALAAALGRVDEAIDPAALVAEVKAAISEGVTKALDSITVTLDASSS